MLFVNSGTAMLSGMGDLGVWFGWLVGWLVGLVGWLVDGCLVG